MMQIENMPMPVLPPGSWLYLMGTSADYKRTKIGMTTNNPMLRFATLRCGDPHLFMHAAFYFPQSCSLQAFELEKRVHIAYSPIRIEFHNGGLSEWFGMNCNYAEAQCQEFIENQFDSQPRSVRSYSSFTYAIGVDILKAYESDLISHFGPVPVLDESGIPW
ncbi:hypothetical protein GCN78_25775 [Janthinobacterium rivuli]|uniref:GIY-YIG nuclease family protein n=1 Tax=Janthinobacterium sp. FT68W TaxID=2654255 RepID=UPI0012646CD0|nr:hypothetical protein GCN78_25775 [Janthinobacterium sp. FT68W]